MRGNMRAERARIGLSTKKVAEALGGGASQIWRWERGLQEPSGSNLLKMASRPQGGAGVEKPAHTRQPPPNQISGPGGGGGV